MTYATEVAADSPLLVWHLDETSGTVADDAVGSLDGTYSGAYTLGQPSLIADGSGGNAVSFTTGKAQSAVTTSTYGLSLIHI